MVRSRDLCWGYNAVSNWDKVLRFISILPHCHNLMANWWNHRLSMVVWYCLSSLNKLCLWVFAYKNRRVHWRLSVPTERKTLSGMLRCLLFEAMSQTFWRLCGSNDWWGWNPASTILQTELLLEQILENLLHRSGQSWLCLQCQSALQWPPEPHFPHPVKVARWWRKKIH